MPPHGHGYVHPWACSLLDLPGFVVRLSAVLLPANASFRTSHIRTLLIFADVITKMKKSNPQAALSQPKSTVVPSSATMVMLL